MRIQAWSLNGRSKTTRNKQVIGRYTPICTLPLLNVALLPAENARNRRIRAISVPRHLPRRVRGVLARFGELWVQWLYEQEHYASDGADGLPEKRITQYNVVYIPTRGIIKHVFVYEKEKRHVDFFAREELLLLEAEALYFRKVRCNLTGLR